MTAKEYILATYKVTDEEATHIVLYAGEDNYDNQDDFPGLYKYYHTYHDLFLGNVDKYFQKKSKRRNS